MTIHSSRNPFDRNAEEKRKALEGDNPTPVERLLVGQVVTTWMEVQYAQLQATAGTAQSPRILRRAESAQKRHLAAIRSLTTVRALVPRGLLPAAHLKIFDGEKKMG